VDVEEDAPVDDIAGKKRGTGLVVTVIAAGGDDPLTNRGQDEQGGDDSHQDNGPGARPREHTGEPAIGWDVAGFRRNRTHRPAEAGSRPHGPAFDAPGGVVTPHF